MKIPKMEKERRELIVQKGSGKIPEAFWEMPRPKDPEGLLLKALLKDRGEG